MPTGPFFSGTLQYKPTDIQNMPPLKLLSSDVIWRINLRQKRNPLVPYNLQTFLKIKKQLTVCARASCIAGAPLTVCYSQFLTAAVLWLHCQKHCPRAARRGSTVFPCLCPTLLLCTRLIPLQPVWLLLSSISISVTLVVNLCPSQKVWTPNLIRRLVLSLHFT